MSYMVGLAMGGHELLVLQQHGKAHHGHSGQSLRLSSAFLDALSCVLHVTTARFSHAAGGLNLVPMAAQGRERGGLSGMALHAACFPPPPF